MNQTTPPFSIVPLEICADDRLTKMQIKVLIALYSFRNKNTDVSFPSRQALSERCGYSLSNISRVTTDLVRLGWLEKTGRGGYSRACQYRITVPDLETVPESETVSEPDTQTVPESDTQRCPNRAGARNRPRTDHGTERSVADKPATRPDSTDYQLASFIWQGVQTAAPKTRPPNLERWADTLRLMRQRDGLRPREIAVIFKWANQHEFWRANILSPDKLRKQFARLDAEYRSMSRSQQETRPARPIRESLTDRSWADPCHGGDDDDENG